MTEDIFLAGTLKAVAVAGLLSLGGTVISNKLDNVRQDEQIEQLREIKQETNEIRDLLREIKAEIEDKNNE